MNKVNLTLDEAELKVTVRKPVKKLPSDAMRVLVKGLSEKTTSDGLASYMEVVSGLEVSCIEFGQQGCALVTFSDAYGKLCFVAFKWQSSQAIRPKSEKMTLASL